LGQVAGNNQQFRVEQLHDGGATHRQVFGQSQNRAASRGVACIPRGNDFLRGMEIPAASIAQKGAGIGVSFQLLLILNIFLGRSGSRPWRACW